MVHRKNQPPRESGRLAAQDWIDAALTAIGEGGLRAVAVEPLAKRLGTTKGSFYWHFANRDALIEAALSHWEETNTEHVIAAVEPEPDPQRRLRSLFKAVPAAATSGDPIEVTLLTSISHPQVAAVLRRVTERRIAFVTQIFTDLGFPADEAHRRGVLVYTAHLGQIQLLHAVPQALPSDVDGQRRYLDTLLRTLTSKA
ncbi:TetR/AcrR family transcriptional regulator [Streptomyces sp. NPDC002055]|uniref:TetR/AcrR family transcriptional regulator n=1 Tax=Streptomyces sp. NPDC002055 TaxID=3154534 RepID=UPI00332FBD4B